MTKPHNPNCAIVRQGNTRAWCDCGVDSSIRDNIRSIQTQIESLRDIGDD